MALDMDIDKKTSAVVVRETASPSPYDDSINEKVEICESTLTYYSSTELTTGEKLRIKLKKLFAPGIESSQDTSPEERRFVRKLDLILMTYGCLAYMIKSIDQTNYINAYVSGMKEDLHMRGNELNLMSTFFTIGYSLGLIPSQIMLTKVKPNYWLPPLECIWGILTSLMMLMPTVHGMYALRFGIGAAESSSWPGMMCVFMNWYTPTEFATRAALFAVAGSTGNMIAGALQAGLFKTLNGVHGIPGWRWMFLVSGMMTIGISLIGLFALPDPQKGAIWMTSRDMEIAKERMERIGRKTKAKFQLKTFKDVFGDYRVWIFLAVYALKALAQKSTTYFSLFIKSIKMANGITPKYTIEQVNYIPMTGPATEIVFALFYSKLADLTGKGHALIGFQFMLVTFALSILSAWPPSFGLKFAAYIMIYSTTSTTPILMSWMARVWREYPERRALITGMVTLCSNANEAWMVLVLWPATQAPSYPVGFKCALAFIVCAFFALIAFYRKVGP